MRQASDGIPIAAIVARETTDKTWQGTGSGIGFGTGGLGLMFGGVTGATTEQSNRARGFTLPDVARERWFWALGPIIGVVVAVGMTSVIVDMMPSIIGDGGDVPPVFARLLNILPTIVHVLGVLGVVGIGVVLMLDLNPRVRHERERVDRDTVAHRQMQKVHARLRYVEADHVIFDPVTGQEVPANNTDMISLVETLASRESPQG